MIGTRKLKNIFARTKDSHNRSTVLFSINFNKFFFFIFLFSTLFSIGCSDNLLESVSKDGEVFPGKMSARSLTESADIYYSQGDIVRAQELYNQALTVDPQYAPAMEGLVGVDTDIFFKTNFGAMFPQIANFSTFIVMIVESYMRNWSKETNQSTTDDQGLGLTAYSQNIINNSNNILAALSAEQLTLLISEVDKQIARLSALSNHSRSSMTTLTLLKSFTLSTPMKTLINNVKLLELLVYQLKDNGTQFYADMQKFASFEPTDYMVITNPSVDSLYQYHLGAPISSLTIDNSSLITKISEIQNAYQRNLYVYRFFTSTNFAARQSEIYALQNLLQSIDVNLIDSTDGVFGQVTGGMVKIKNKIDKLAAEISDAKKTMYSEYFRLQTLAMFDAQNPDKFKEEILTNWGTNAHNLASVWILAKYGYSVSIISVNFSTDMGGAQQPFYNDLTYCGISGTPGSYPFDDVTGYNSFTEVNYWISDYWYYPCSGPNRFVDATL